MSYRNEIHGLDSEGEPVRMDGDALEHYAAEAEAGYVVGAGGKLVPDVAPIKATSPPMKFLAELERLRAEVEKAEQALEDADQTSHRQLQELSDWIDDWPENARRDPEALTWGRLAKVSEEAGEVIAAFISVTGQNPRKTERMLMLAVESELLDVALTALCAVAHLRREEIRAGTILDSLRVHIAAVHSRAGLDPS